MNNNHIMNRNVSTYTSVIVSSFVWTIGQASNLARILKNKEWQVFKLKKHCQDSEVLLILICIRNQIKDILHVLFIHTYATYVISSMCSSNI